MRGFTDRELAEEWAKGEEHLQANLRTELSKDIYEHIFLENSSEEEVIALIGALDENTVPNYLFLGDACCTDNIFKAIGEMLSINTTLIGLSLCYTQNVKEGIIRLKDGLLQNKTLEVFRLATMPDITQEPNLVCYLVKALKNSSIKELGLGKYCFSDRDKRVLLDIIKTNPAIIEPWVNEEFYNEKSPSIILLKKNMIKVINENTKLQNCLARMNFNDLSSSKKDVITCLQILNRREELNPKYQKIKDDLSKYYVKGVFTGSHIIETNGTFASTIHLSDVKGMDGEKIERYVLPVEVTNNILSYINISDIKFKPPFKSLDYLLLTGAVVCSSIIASYVVGMDMLTTLLTTSAITAGAMRFKNHLPSIIAHPINLGLEATQKFVDLIARNLPQHQAQARA